MLLFFFFLIHRDFMKSPNAKLLQTCGNGCLAQPHRELKAMDHIFKNENHCVFQINCISLPHQPLRWAAQIDQFKCDLLSFPSIRSESVAKKQWKEVRGRRGYLCGEHATFPKFTHSSLCIGRSRQPSGGQGWWYHPILQIKKLRQDQGFV